MRGENYTWPLVHVDFYSIWQMIIQSDLQKCFVALKKKIRKKILSKNTNKLKPYKS